MAACSGIDLIDDPNGGFELLELDSWVEEPVEEVDLPQRELYINGMCCFAKINPTVINSRLLTSVTMNRTELSSGQWGNLLDSLQQRPLKVLDLSHNPFDLATACKIAALVKRVQTLETVRLVSCCLSHFKFASDLGKVSKHHTSLRRMDLSQNSFKNGSFLFVQAGGMNRLHACFMRCCGIDDEMAAHIGLAIVGNPDLQEVNLVGNNISPLGTKVILQIVDDHRQGRLGPALNFASSVDFNRWPEVYRRHVVVYSTNNQQEILLQPLSPQGLRNFQSPEPKRKRNH